MGRHETAQRTLDVAAEIIDRDGIGALTIRALVAASGTSVGSIYHHLGGLDGVIDEVRDDALADWAAGFVAALRRAGLPAAYAADGRWRRAHRGLGELIHQTGRLGPGARQFGVDLRAWLDDRGLAAGAPASVVAAITLGPLLELRRQERVFGRSISAGEIRLAAEAVDAALAAMAR